MRGSNPPKAAAAAAGPGVTAAAEPAAGPGVAAPAEPAAGRARGTSLRAAAHHRHAGTVALAGLLLAAGAWLLYETRGTTLWFDEWIWATEYRDNTFRGFVAPHNGHPTLIPVAIYRLLFATVGIDQSLPYRVVGVAGHLLCVTLVYVYALRRVGTGLALLAALAILLLGPGWQNILWGLQIGWLVSIAGGLGALLMLDRRDRFGDVAACVLLFITIAASGPGIAIAAGIAVEVVRGRGLRRAWIAAVPLAIFAIWWLAYYDSEAVRRDVGLAPAFAADSFAATMAALAGLAGPLIGEEGTTMAWGRPLAVAAAGLVLWRLWRVDRVPTRVLTLLAILGVFWLLTGLQRASFGPAESSRYVYVSAVFVVALAVELLRGVTLSPRAWIVTAGAALLIAAGNVADMRSGAAFLRGQGLQTRTGLTTLEIARPVVAPGHVAEGIAGYPLVQVRADQYFAMARDMGTPAASVEELIRAPEGYRLAADAELTRIHEAALVPTEPPTAASPTPAVDAATAGTPEEGDGCVTFEPAPAGPAEPPPALDLTVPEAGLVLTAEGGPATVRLRRFADGFPEEPLSRIAAGGSARLALAADLDRTPWHVRLQPEARVTACGATPSR